MPTAIPNGGGSEELTTGDLIAYNSTQQTAPGAQSTAEQQVSTDVEARVQVLAAGWTDTPSVDPLEVLQRSARLQGDVAGAVRQWARSGSERRMLEMIGSLTAELTVRDRELLELKARLDASPY
jgi:hypothetical protein